MKKLICSLFIICSVNLFVQSSQKDMQNRFMKYIAINSQSQTSEDPKAFPITEGQKEMARYIQKEISELIGVRCVVSDDFYVYAIVPSNMKKQVPSLGISTHIDVTPECNAQNIKPRIIDNYDGTDIQLNDELTLLVDSPEGAHLKDCIGKTIVCTDGNSLLGGDDKAGMAIAMTLLQQLSEQGNKMSHGEIQFVFAPNEDIGLAAERLDKDIFHPDILVDLDGGLIGSVLNENFTAKQMIVKFIGKAAHPSEAKALGMGDALTCSARFIAEVPLECHPANSDSLSGYIHCWNMEKSGNDDYIVSTRIRYFSRQEGELFNRILHTAIKHVREDFPNVKVEILDERLQYENVKYSMHPQSLDIVTKAMIKAGVSPKPEPIRAGTTAAMMAARGLAGGLCLFTGQNAEHTVKEWVCIEDMYKAYETMVNVVNGVAGMK
ncbi:MAG: tripeptide aminopeptidase PepT [Muribaculaceae bacterium]